MKISLLLVLALLVTALGCAPRAAGEDAAPQPRADRNVIGLAEIEASGHHASAYELVRAVRPTWLHRRASATMANPNAAAVAVYIDEVRIGGVDVLRRTASASIVRMQYLDPKDATTRFGTGNTGGVIMVVTHNGRG